MMSYQKHVAIIFLIFFCFFPVSGMNLGLWGSKKYDRVDDHVDAAEIAKLLGKPRLSRNKQILLASCCEKFPSACANKSLFTKIDPNLQFKNGDSVVRSYVKLLQNGASELAPLVMEAFSNPKLNPHLISPIRGDLALDILRGDDAKLAHMILEHDKFNPNHHYGDEREPLASKLIKSKKYEALDFLLGHKSFDNKVADKSGVRPGFYLLKERNKIQEDRFFAFMGTQLANWNLVGLGLGEPQQLNFLLRELLKTREDQLLIFKKYIEQIVMLNEVNPPEHAEAFPALTLLLGLDALGTEVYIDKDFTQQALKMLVDYRLLEEKIENGVHPFMFWSEKAIADLSKANIASLRKAFHDHHASTHEKSCTICLEEYKGSWFKSSKSCEHVACARCWLEAVGSHTYEEDLLCPERDCGMVVPPSLYLALNIAALDDDPDYENLLKAYKAQLSYHQTRHEIFRGGVPNLRTCTSCKADFMFDNKLPKPRKLACPQCKTPHVLTDDGKNELSPITLNGTWGYCHECKTVVDKTVGCNAIHCPICKKGTGFIPL